MSEFVKTVTVTKPVSGRILDLCNFIATLRKSGKIECKLTNAEIVEAAEDFWDTAHGEE